VDCRRADFAQAIRQAATQLKPGGILLFDLLPAGQLERYAAEQPYVHDEGDLAYMWTCEWDASEQTIYHDIVFFLLTPDGSYTRFEETHAERAYAKADVEQLLEQAGFTDVNWSSDLGRAPYSDAASRVFVSARLR
jgi:SAM-dependent methyltransferase